MDKYLEHAQLQGSDFTRACLVQTNFKYAQLAGVDFKGANLKDADLRGATFPNADFRGANLEGAKVQYRMFFRDDFNAQVLVIDVESGQDWFSASKAIFDPGRWKLVKTDEIDEISKLPTHRIEPVTPTK